MSLNETKLYSMKGFVNMYVTYSKDGQNFISMNPSWIFPRIKCIWTSMYLVRYLWTRSLHSLRLLWLSHHITIRRWKWNPNSVRKCYNQISWVVTFIAPMYSTFVNDKEIFYCFFAQRTLTSFSVFSTSFNLNRSNGLTTFPFEGTSQKLRLILIFNTDPIAQCNFNAILQPNFINKQTNSDLLN